MIKIIPAILATTEEEYHSKLQKIDSSELFEGGWVQIDIADNKFVRNQTIGLEILNKYPTDLNKEVHLMVDDPINWLEKSKQGGIARVIFHAETTDIHKTLDRAWELGLMVGLALNPETSLDVIKPFIDRLDVVQIMGVHPGFSGQEFLSDTPERVKQASQLRVKNDKLDISVDGGVGSDNAKTLISAGADHLILASHLLNGDIEENLEHLWEAINS